MPSRFWSSQLSFHFRAFRTLDSLHSLHWSCFWCIRLPILDKEVTYWTYFTHFIVNSEPIDRLIAEYRETMGKLKDGEMNPLPPKKSRNLRSAFPNIFVVISSFNLVIVCVSHILYWIEAKNTVLAPDESNFFLIFVVSNLPVVWSIFRNY